MNYEKFSFDFTMNKAEIEAAMERLRATMEKLLKKPTITRTGPEKKTLPFNLDRIEVAQIDEG